MTITSIKTLLPLIFVFVVFALVFIPLFKQETKFFKGLKALEEQDKKIQEMDDKQNNKGEYNDFTDGHLYQK